MSSIYSIRPDSGSERIALECIWDGDGPLAGGYSSFVALPRAGKLDLIAYNRATQKTDVYALGDGAPWIGPVDSKIDLAGGPWDSVASFVLGNVPYLLTYRADDGTFGFFAISADLTASPPYRFALPRNTPTRGFTTVVPFTSLGQQYILGYDFGTRRVANFSVAVTPASVGGAPPLLALNVWYHEWAKGWTQFSFFQLGGANFFFKINTAKLNVNIDHIQDNPALGTVEVGSYLQNQLPDALKITNAACVPWAHGAPTLVTYIAGDGATAVYRIHADCLGWTRIGAATTVEGASHVVPYRVGDASYALFYQGRTIEGHAMNPNTVPPAARDLAWIKRALQTAIELEYSTLPLYLSAMFSLEVQNYTAYNAIRSIAMEEMVHMAIAANLLAALGGSPQFKTIQVAYPTTGLPGGAEPDLRVGLAHYSKPQLKNFLRIETPAFLLRELVRDESHPTIAAFYASIRDAVERNADAVRAAVQTGGPANQVGDDIGFTTVTYTPGVDPVESFHAGIDEILQQGEGSGRGDVFAGDPFEDEESHYARFAELYYGARYQAPSPPVDFNPKNEPLFFGGPAIAAPVVINTLAVPRDGYAKILALDPDRTAVENDLNAFDTGFSTILSTLDAVWNGLSSGSWKTLGAAVHGMVDLRVLSCFNIMRHPVPAAAVAQLAELYPDEIGYLHTYTELSKPVFYGPRFVNVNGKQAS